MSDELAKVKAWAEEQAKYAEFCADDAEKSGVSHESGYIADTRAEARNYRIAAACIDVAKAARAWEAAKEAGNTTGAAREYGRRLGALDALLAEGGKGE